MYVCMSKPSSADKAMDAVRWYQHVHQAVHGKPAKRDGKRSQETEGPRNAYAVQESTPLSVSTVSRTPNEPVADTSTTIRLKALEEAIGKMQACLDRLSEKPKRGKTPGTPGTCYHCGDGGHFRNNCPKLITCQKCGTKSHKTVDCPHKGPVCYQCQEPGHFKRDCPHLPAGRRTMGKSRDLNGQGSRK